MATDFESLRVGQRIRVRHRIDRRDVDWRAEVTGVVEWVGLEKTGSWYAHAKDDRYWLRRVRLRKEDGEISTLNLDEYAEIEILGSGEGASA